MKNIVNIQPDCKTKLEFGLFEIGSPTSACYACCFPQCALAEAKSILDNSPFLYNTLFRLPYDTIHSIHSIYGLPTPDLFSSCCYTRCHANQLYQSTLQKQSLVLHNDETKPTGKFEINLLACGNVNDAFYACLCPWCAFASSRTILDNSPFCFNLLCIPGIISTWLTMSSYDIPVDSCSLCWNYYCCFPCEANRVYQTVKKRGNPNIDLSSSHSIPGHHYCFYPRSMDDLQVCLYSILCSRCFTGDMMKIHLDMPLWLGVCCVYPWSAYNIFRYHYRIQGNDWLECFFPTIGLSLCLPPFTILDWGVGLETYCSFGQMATRLKINPLDGYSNSLGMFHVSKPMYLTKKIDGLEKLRSS